MKQQSSSRGQQINNGKTNKATGYAVKDTYQSANGIPGSGGPEDGNWVNATANCGGYLLLVGAGGVPGELDNNLEQLNDDTPNMYDKNIKVFIEK